MFDMAQSSSVTAEQYSKRYIPVTRFDDSQFGVEGRYMVFNLHEVATYFTSTVLVRPGRVGARLLR